MDMKLEVVPIPVRDVDAAKDFYIRQVGFRLDHDVQPSENMRVVQMTPPGSACSVVLGVGLPLGEPGSVKGVQLVVEDLDTVRGDLAGRGVPVSDVAQMGPEGGLRDRRIYRGTGLTVKQMSVASISLGACWRSPSESFQSRIL